MKKLLLLSLLLGLSSVCFASQPVDKEALLAIKTEIINQSQAIKKELNDIAAQYGDLCIVPMKIANEVRSHDVVKKAEKKLITYFFLRFLKKVR